VTLAVTNRLREQTSIHWQGVRSPADMDGQWPLEKHDLSGAGGKHRLIAPVVTNDGLTAVG